MNLHVINTGFFKLDGGAMFGVVPKTLWQKTNPADDKNLCTWAMRCLLIEDGNKLILVDTGIGDKQDDKFLSHYYLHGEDTLIKSIHKAGFSENDITDVILTHLHFDHCGGATVYNKDRTKIEPTFKNAVYWSNEDHWKWASIPNAREKASFLKENIFPLRESGKLEFVGIREETPFKSINFLFVDGHTDKQMIPVIDYKGKKIVFAADLLPSVGHIPIPYIMAYDTRPLISMQEKEIFFRDAISKDYIIFLEHDPVHECCTIKETEKGFRVKDTFKLKEVL
ncbi:MAG: MBL fold metallo-hydrolase [Sporocytophaga sp.]|uniref:MBL fold metallo-hydrolase n=1 Tax=Sporocytophaga sp. TaxID=2231183 RepID=UPI001B2CAC47|nr:MBL fold metallo-hydrolase [Sporocytophaga sp.]MBO9700671.1 MBL fold metallo-hydrolase [Sporocytophaga sp.]